MSAPSVLERCRMALAEVGYAPELVASRNGRILMSDALPEMVRWMVVCTVAYHPMCLPCYRRLNIEQVMLPERDRAALVDALRAACGAWRPFQRVSCGALEDNP